MTSDNHSSSRLTGIGKTLDTAEIAAFADRKLRVAFLPSTSGSSDEAGGSAPLVSHLAAEEDISVVSNHRPNSLTKRILSCFGVADIWSQAERVDLFIAQVRGLDDVISRFFPVLIAARFHHRRMIGIVDFDSTLWRQPLIWRFVRALFKQADVLISPTEWQAGTLRRIGLASTVIPPIQPVSTSQPLSSVQPHVRLRIGKRHVGDLARILQSFSLVKQKYPRAELTIDAPPKLSSIVDSCVAATGLQVGAGVFRAKSVQSESSTVADITICLDTETAYPYELVTAWRTGTPALVPAYSLVSSLVRDRHNALIYSSNTAGSLADAIIGLVENPPLVQQLSIQGLRESQAFAWPALRTRWRALLQSSM